MIHKVIFLGLMMLLGARAEAVNPITYKPTPESIMTPDHVETRLGTLAFFDGYPSAETVDVVYDNLDFQRGVRAFLDVFHRHSAKADVVFLGLQPPGQEEGLRLEGPGAHIAVKICQV